MWRNLYCVVPLLFAFIMISCESKQEYSWAFAQNMDGTFNEKEYCRRALADVIYNDVMKDSIHGAGSSNVFLYESKTETYQIHAFDSQSKCETILTNMMIRKAATERK